MVYPINLHLFGLEINSHLLFEELGFVLGFRYYLYLRKRQKDLIDSQNRIWIFCGAAFGALVFSRLLGDLENPEQFFNIHTPWIYYYTNKTIIGGLLGGLIGTEIAKYFLKVKTSSGDLLALPLILAIGLGRIGCALAGLGDNTYGSPTSLPWGIDMGDGIIRHPTAIYEILFLFILWIVLITINSHYVLKNGFLFKLFIVSYLIFRFCIEFIKPVYRFGFGLSVLQLACLAGLVYYYKFFLHLPFEAERNEYPVEIKTNTPT